MSSDESADKEQCLQCKTIYDEDDNLLGDCQECAYNHRYQAKTCKRCLIKCDFCSEVKCSSTHRSEPCVKWCDICNKTICAECFWGRGGERYHGTYPGHYGNAKFKHESNITTDPNQVSYGVQLIDLDYNALLSEDQKKDIIDAQLSKALENKAVIDTTHEDKYFDNFNYENWAHLLKSEQPYNLSEWFAFELSNQDIAALLQGLKPMLAGFKERFYDSRTSKKLEFPLFFKLSTRSGKDAYLKLKPELEVQKADSIATKRRKWEQQLDYLKASSVNDIILNFGSSQRIKDDLQNHLDRPDTMPSISMNIIYQPWEHRFIDQQFRVFVKNFTVVCACHQYWELAPSIYKSFDWNNLPMSKKILHPTDWSLLNRVIFRVGNHTESNMVIDYYRNENGHAKLIEINPFARTTDSYKFNWDHIMAS